MAFVLNPFTGEFDAVTDPLLEPFVFTANCLATDAVNCCVCVSGDSIAGVLQVTQVDAADPSKMPAVGIIISKPSTTTCVVAYFGVISLSGLVPNKRYFVGGSGLPTSSIPLFRPVIVQVLGQAIDSSRLLLTPSKDLVRLNP